MQRRHGNLKLSKSFKATPWFSRLLFRPSGLSLELRAAGSCMEVVHLAPAGRAPLATGWKVPLWPVVLRRSRPGMEVIWGPSASVIVWFNHCCVSEYWKSLMLAFRSFYFIKLTISPRSCYLIVCLGHGYARRVLTYPLFGLVSVCIK